jgi:hypothetical protein
MKKLLLTILAVFITWVVMDMVIHGLLLGKSYMATAELWRPMEDMKRGIIWAATLISAAVFTGIYASFFGRKTMGTALAYGLLFGIGAGISMGYGTYAVMPIPYHMALIWFTGTLAETLAGGFILGLVFKE